MKIRTFAILFAAFCILLVVVFLTAHQEKSDGGRDDMGAKLFAGLSAGDIAAITITGPEAVSNLKQTPDGWIVENRLGYPADFSKIAELAQKLAAAKVGRSFPSSAEIQARQALYPPETPQEPIERKGIRIVLQDKDAKILADLIVGKSRDGSAGAETYYILLPSTDRVYLVDQSFRFLEKKPAGWLNKKPIDLNPKKIRKVVCVDTDKNVPLYVLERPGLDRDPILSGLPAGKKMAKFKADQIFEALTSFAVEDVAAKGRKEAERWFSGTPRFDYHLYDGTVYHIFPGSALKDGSENHYFRAEVSYQAPENAAPEQKEGQADPAPEAEKLNLKISPWTFVISKWVHDSFSTDPETFIEKEDKK